MEKTGGCIYLLFVRILIRPRLFENVSGVAKS